MLQVLFFLGLSFLLFYAICQDRKHVDGEPKAKFDGEPKAKFLLNPEAQKTCMLAQIAEKYPETSKNTTMALNNLIHQYEIDFNRNDSLGTVLRKRAEFIAKKNDILLVDIKAKFYTQLYTAVLDSLSDRNPTGSDTIYVKTGVGLDQSWQDELNVICKSCDLQCSSSTIKAAPEIKAYKNYEKKCM